MTKEQLLRKLKGQIAEVFDSKEQAAKYFGITRQRLGQIISNKDGTEVPPYILDFMGYKKIDKYEKVQK